MLVHVHPKLIVKAILDFYSISRKEVYIHVENLYFTFKNVLLIVVRFSVCKASFKGDFLSFAETISSRFAGAGVTIDNTEETRRGYRETLFTSPGISDHISGVILHHETFYQKSKDGIPFVKVIIYWIKCTFVTFTHWPVHIIIN